MNPTGKFLTLMAAIFGLCASTPAHACTGITLKPQDGAVIFGRTLEFGADLQSNLLVLPRGQKFVGSTPSGEPGMPWTTKYGAVGMNAFGQPLYLDGMNEKGLHVGLFYFPGYAQYQPAADSDRARTIGPHELGVYLLGVCANVDEAAAAVKNVVVADVMFQQLGEVPPAHYLVTDASGKAIVIEYVGGQLQVRDNPLGVLTNSPTFDWHMTNLCNYINLNVMNTPQVDLGGVDFRSFGQGNGLHGLPGDFSPPSRFVRAAIFSKSALPVATAEEGVLQAFHLLNQFDIPKGSARSLEQGKVVCDYTLWTAAADLKNLRYYYRTFANSRIRMVDLHSLEFNAPAPQTISIAGPEEIENVSQRAK